MVGEVDEALFDLDWLGPDLRGDEFLVEIGQVHECGEVVAEADRVDDGEADLSRRQTGEEAQHHRLQRGDGSGPALVAGTQQHRAAVRERQECGDESREFLRRSQALV